MVPEEYGGGEVGGTDFKRAVRHVINRRLRHCSHCVCVWLLEVGGSD